MQTRTRVVYHVLRIFFLQSIAVQGWRSGESTLIPPNVARIQFANSVSYVVEFVGSLLSTERFFSGSDSRFPLSSKTNF